MSGNLNVGGLVGSVGRLDISRSGAAVDVTGSEYVGGLVGVQHGKMTDCYALGSVTGNDYVGGLVGGLMYSAINNSYAAGSIKGKKDGNTGGIVGGSPYNPGEYIDCYFDEETTGQGERRISAHATLTLIMGTPKTTAEMKRQATFSPGPGAGWDFENVWTIQEGVTYPYLKGQTPADLPVAAKGAADASKSRNGLLYLLLIIPLLVVLFLVVKRKRKNKHNNAAS